MRVRHCGHSQETGTGMTAAHDGLLWGQLSSRLSPLFPGGLVLAGGRGPNMWGGGQGSATQPGAGAGLTWRGLRFLAQEEAVQESL